MKGLLGVLFVIAAIIAMGMYVEKLGYKADALAPLQAHYQAASDSLTIASMAIAVYETETWHGRLPEHARDIYIGTSRFEGNQPCEVQDANLAVEARYPITFRGTGFNLYTGNSASGHLIVYYKNINISP